MSGSGWELLRLFLHLTAASIWVGGQLVLAALVRPLRAAGRDVPAVAARAFARVAWPAFGVLLVTGAWNTWAVRDELHGGRAAVYAGKLVAVALSGLAAFVHGRTDSPGLRAVSGAGTGLAALAALLLGVRLSQ